VAESTRLDPHGLASQVPLLGLALFYSQSANLDCRVCRFFRRGWRRGGAFIAMCSVS